MSFEHSAHRTESQSLSGQERPGPERPSQAVQDEAAKIIARMDGSGDFQKHIFGDPQYDTTRALQVRELLIKDSQSLSPKDMRDLMLTVMNNEDHKKGYDLEIYGHSTREIREKTEHIDQERQNLGMLMANCSKEERLAAFAEFNKKHDQELTDYKKELVLTMTHHSTPGEYGEKGRTPGDPIQVAAYRSVNGLPDFKIVDNSQK
ncbi:MAG: hypothetical protein KGS72_07830 [Cyanobacteria bacterium REEB67]|nr:hypothetical protein [Cyanobacteria bacterium REEB67]